MILAESKRFNRQLSSYKYPIIGGHLLINAHSLTGNWSLKNWSLKKLITDNCLTGN